MEPLLPSHQGTVKKDDERKQTELVQPQAQDLVEGSSNYDYNLEIEIEPAALKELKKSKVKLVVAKFIRGSEPLGDLIVTAWLASPDFAKNNFISWNNEYEAYFFTDLKAGEKIKQPIKCGQTFVIRDKQAEVIGEKDKGSDCIIQNNSDFDVRAGLCQEISFNHKDLGVWRTTVQTVKARSQESIFVEDRLFVTFALDNIKSGDYIMNSTSYPAMEVNFKFGHERKIFYYGKMEGRPFGLWDIDSEDTWAIEHCINTSLREKLRQSYFPIGGGHGWIKDSVRG